METDFNKWLMGRPNWSEILFEYNTGKKYQSKQDLVALFWNSYIYFQQKAESYFKEFGVLPYDVLNELTFEFRQKFPNSGRVEGVNYFDDLINQLISKYEKLKTEPKPIDKNENILELTEKNLIKCGFDSETIIRLLTWDNHKEPYTLQSNLGTFLASNIDKKIYIGTEAFRKIYLGDKENPRFPFNDLDLVEEYYNLKELNYLRELKVDLKSIYNEDNQKQEFKDIEIKELKKIINDISTSNKSHLGFNIKNLKVFKGYLNWLEQEQQSEPNDNTKDFNTVNKPEDSRTKLKKDYLGFLKHDQVSDSYDCFKDFLFTDITFDEYLICFDLDKPIEKHPTFINGNTINFIVFLDEIPGFKISDKIALDRFGIKGCKSKRSQGMADNSQNNNFKLKIKPILSKHTTKIN